jgi:glycosyltransferase involved in cell wall biosynthesis
MKVIKFLLTDILFDSRDKREISLLNELGHQVLVICSGVKSEKILNDEGIPIYKIESLNLTKKQPKIGRILRILLRYNYFRKLLISFEADCISCHDLFALIIGWSSTWFIRKAKCPHLVYDSHEFEAERDADRSPFSTWIIIHIERFLVHRTAFNIMVNDTIAEEVRKLHKLSVRPFVVRNVPFYWQIDYSVCSQRRKELLSLLNISPSEDYFIIMYHGGLQKGRGIENVIYSVSKMDRIIAVVLGNGSTEYVKSLHDLILEQEVFDKVILHSAVPIEILWQYLGASDVGIVNLENICKNHYYALPNKLSENIQSETPIIGSNFPEISGIIKGYDIGLICNPHDINDIVTKIKEMRSDKEQYAKFKVNLKITKKQLCWEVEKEVLKKAYSTI